MSSIAVLVVEDDALIRLSIVDHLLGLGLSPVEADTADVAIAILEARDDIQLVFTDVQMPGTMDGIQLARYVRERWPPTAIVICSATKQPDANDLPSNCYWLSKPVDAHSMQAAVDTAKHWLNDGRLTNSRGNRSAQISSAREKRRVTRRVILRPLLSRKQTSHANLSGRG